jgi:FkbM family methyltransferase
MRLTVRQRASWLAHLFKAVTQQHHRDLQPLLTPYVPADAVVLDVGAHAGQFAKLFAAMAPAGRVYAFEPSAYALSILRPALQLNGRSNVTVVQAGLSDAAGELVLHTPVKPRGSLGFGVAHLGEGADEGASWDQRVPLLTLDAFAAREALTRLDFIKVDIEGWEMRALAGGEATLRRFRPALFLEVNADMLARAGDTPAALFDWLSALGYSARFSPGMSEAPTYGAVGDYLFLAP